MGATTGSMMIGSIVSMADVNSSGIILAGCSSLSEARTTVEFAGLKAETSSDFSASTITMVAATTSVDVVSTVEVSTAVVPTAVVTTEVVSIDAIASGIFSDGGAT